MLEILQLSKLTKTKYFPNFLWQMCAPGSKRLKCEPRLSKREDFSLSEQIVMQLKLLSLSLPLSPSPHHKIRENWIQGQLQLFRPKPAPTEPSQFTQSSLAYYPPKTWMDACVGVFVFCTSTIFLCYLDNRVRVERSQCMGTDETPFRQHRALTDGHWWSQPSFHQLGSKFWVKLDQNVPYFQVKILQKRKVHHSGNRRNSSAAITGKDDQTWTCLDRNAPVLGSKWTKRCFKILQKQIGCRHSVNIMNFSPAIAMHWSRGTSFGENNTHKKLFPSNISNIKTENPQERFPTSHLSKTIMFHQKEGDVWSDLRITERQRYFKRPSRT